MINIEDLSVKYDNKSLNWILSDLNLQFECKTCVGLIGSNGSGKTTLAHSLVGIIPYLIDGVVKGRFLLNEQNLINKPINYRLKQVSYSFQDVESQILFGNVSDIIGFNEKTSPKELIRNIVNILGIEDLLDRNPDELSGGEAQRVALAGAFRLNPQLIIYDEATSALDPITKRKFSTLLKYLKSINKSILLLGQRPEILFPYTDITYSLSKGKITQINSNEENAQLENIKYSDFWKTKIGTLNTENNFKNEINIQEISFSRSKQNGFNLDINNLKFNKGENIAILGKNGSGKTTFFYLLNGLIKSKRFKYQIDRKTERKNKALVDLIKTVYHSPTNQIIGSTINEELYWLKKEIKNVLFQEFPFLNIEKDPLDLSFGQQRFLCLLSAFLSKYPILLIDEPEYGIDSTNINYIKSYIKLNKIKKSKTILFSTHDLTFAHEMADRCILMDKGRIISEIIPSGNSQDIEKWFFHNTK